MKFQSHSRLRAFGFPLSEKKEMIPFGFRVSEDTPLVANIPVGSSR